MVFPINDLFEMGMSVHYRSSKKKVADLSLGWHRLRPAWHGYLRTQVAEHTSRVAQPSESVRQPADDSPHQASCWNLAGSRAKSNILKTVKDDVMQGGLDHHSSDTMMIKHFQKPVSHQNLFLYQLTNLDSLAM
ncbi:hypothetical protein CEXT_749191 [Caerostris extrusa]|uniref:Uncharacterized protein n=1 Tax=Caerostris extrusa TaxID=172846 RepID=A0AAV4VSE9_CAEEX|nr:hypothetical protein CEXT_749191 [Caerostris extrusa]